MKRSQLFTGIISILFFSHCEHNTDPLINTVFQVSYKSQNIRYGPGNNSGFICKLHDTIPPLFLTAHHVVAGYAPDKYYEWNKVNDYISEVTIWSIHDTSLQRRLAKNLPITNAKTLALDLAAFYVTAKEDIPALKPATSPAVVGDTIRLLAKLNGTNQFLNSAVVIYATDSVLVYELTSSNPINLGGSSGSPVLNKNNEVVANSYGGLMIPDAIEKERVEQILPWLRKVKIQEGKTYGIGIPMQLIQQSLIDALKLNQMMKEK